MGKKRSARATSASVTFDAGALIALDRGDGRITALLRLVAERSGRVQVPAGALGQAWRDGTRQALLARFLRAAEVEIAALDAELARASGELCAATSTADVIDASVVLTARALRTPIVTSDVDDLRRLDPTATLVRI